MTRFSDTSTPGTFFIFYVFQVFALFFLQGGWLVWWIFISKCTEMPQYSKNLQTTMTMALHSSLKRSETCLDLITIHCQDQNEIRDHSHGESLRKRSAAHSFGWDHYKSDDDANRCYDHQSWRNKRSRKQDYLVPQLIGTSRVKIPRHNGISSVLEDGPRPKKNTVRNIPGTVCCTRIYGTSPSGVEENIPDLAALHQIIEDFATMKALQE